MANAIFPVADRESLDEMMLQLASSVATESRDAQTQVGCVMVSGDGERVLVTAANDLVDGAEEQPERLHRPGKYLWVEHAERNAVYRAARCGISLQGATCYLTWWPCADCARALIQAGVRCIVSRHPPDLSDPRWGQEFARTEELLTACGIVRRFHKCVS